MITRFYSLLICTLIPGLVLAGDHLRIVDPWVAEAPPVVNNHAGYMTIINQGNTTVHIRRISSPVYDRIALHRTVESGGMTRMEHVEQLDVPPGKTVLKPGDFHLMLYNAGQALVAGDNVAMSIVFSDGTVLEISAPVMKMSGIQSNNTGGTMEHPTPPALSGLKVFYQHLLPQHFLSSLMYRITRSTLSPLKNLLIRNFIRIYDVDMNLALEPAPTAYEHFNAFFTRELRPGARTIAPAADAMVSPVDGAISRFGKIEAGRLLQAKGRDYSLLSLLGGDGQLAGKFSNGEFITLYLAPRDYHRIHMPLSGTLEKMIYVPGDLYSVSPATTQGIENLFARNERVISIFNTPAGSMALVMVGAIFVGSMETVWAGEITPAKNRTLTAINYKDRDESVHLDKGAEAGRFNMGSTVILLFEPGSIQWNTTLSEDDSVRLGQKLATLIQ